MIRALFICILLVAIAFVHAKLTCTKCPFHAEPKGHTKCTETCEGDVCYIVVNRFYNGTKIAGCVDLHEGEKFETPAVCYKQEHQTSCACTTKDFCNSPTSPIADFKFQEEKFLEGHQLQPLITTHESEQEQATMQTILPSGDSDAAGIKSSDEHYAPTPNGMPLDAMSSTTMSTTTQFTTVKSEDVVKPNTVANDTVVTWQVGVQVEEDESGKPSTESEQTVVTVAPVNADAAQTTILISETTTVTTETETTVSPSKSTPFHFSLFSVIGTSLLFLVVY
ncbi:unnamed protein product [Cylicocyclus nassatus]|uniref:Uncharacterized protein n=1 Tax=Cylicocyclus nassatus TaxID=53992 RepID=A0AA36HA60_CYLNA|nr:unnamed protein product [Cylicocyclus nassatus]